MTGPSQHEPLDPQERELARVLRALPGAEPSAAIDQRILRAAADAAAASPRRSRRWLAVGGAGWGIGSAAAAVLALGVGWHLLDPARNLPAEYTAPVAAPAEEDAVTVQLGERESPADSTAAIAAPPAPPPVRQSSGPTASARPKRSPASPAPAAAPAPVVPPPAQADAAAPVVAETASGINAIDVASVESTTILAAEAIANEAASDEARSRSAREADASALAKSAAPQRAGAMTPAVWIAQVRSLRDAGRRTEAADSLRRFKQYYPQYAIPADLLPLMRE